MDAQYPQPMEEAGAPQVQQRRLRTFHMQPLPQIQVQLLPFQSPVFFQPELPQLPVKVLLHRSAAHSFRNKAHPGPDLRVGRGHRQLGKAAVPHDGHRRVPQVIQAGVAAPPQRA